MIRNLEQIFRILFRNRTYAILNIAGLSIGIAASALILLWVEYNMNPNRSVPKRNNLHMLGQHQYYGDDARTFFVASPGLCDAIEEQVPGIKRFTRYATNNLTFRIDDNDATFSDFGVYVDSAFFAMIDLPFIAGNAQNAFANANPVVISKKMAQKIFNHENPIGETLYANNQLHEITGIFEDREENGTFRFDWLIPYRIWENNIVESGQLQRGSWSNWFQCYVETEPLADIDVVNENLTAIFKERSGWNNRVELFIYPIQRMRLYGEFKDGMATGGGFIRTVRMFFYIGMAILLIGCINFMNLNTARSQKRAMEVGVRKAFGAKFSRLVRQFLLESSIVTFISLAIGIILVLIVLSPFNQMLSLKLAVKITNPYHSIGILAVGLLCTLLSGAYPAFYLSSFSPLNTLKKLTANLTGSAGIIRKGLVVFQFTISYVLICSTAIVFLQIRHTLNRPLGMELDNLVMFFAPEDMRRNFAAVQEALVNTGVVVNAGLSTQQMIYMGSNGGGYNWQGKAPDVNPLVFNVGISPGLMETAGMRFSEGGDFSWQLLGERQEVIINRSFADIMEEEGRVGGFVESGGMFQIVGIIEDYVFNDFTREKSEPAIFFPNHMNAGRLFVRLKSGVRESEAIEAVQIALMQFAPGASFEPAYMEEVFHRGFGNQRFTGKLAALFAALGVFLSCMGLFGLSAFAAEQRTKEIGVRKVLGATIWDIIYLLGRSFMYLLLISFVIAIPVAWYAGNTYLQDYGYKMSLGWYIFAAACMLVFLIAMLTVSAQSRRAAMADPVKAIKSCE